MIVKEIARDLYKMGYNIIPITPGTKKSHVVWESYSNRRVPAELFKIWLEDTRYNSYGLITGFHQDQNHMKGLSPIIVIDVDDEEGLKYIKSANIPLSHVCVESRPGRHQFYYRRPRTKLRIGNRQKYRIKHPPYNIDLRGDGGYVLIPGSMHPETNKMYYMTPRLIDSQEFANIPTYNPDWFPDWNDERKTDTSGAKCDATSDEHDEYLINCSTPIDSRIMQALAYIKKQPGAKQGQGADSYAFAIAIALVWGFCLPAEDALDLFCQWGIRHDQLNKYGSHYPWGASEIAHKIESALSKQYQGVPGDLLKEDLNKKAEEFFKGKKKEEKDFKEEEQEEQEEHKEHKEQDSTTNEYYYDWSSLLKVRKQQSEQDLWIIPYWLEMGCLHVFTAPPFGGKSVVMADLMASIVSGEKLYGHLETRPHRIFLIDFENKERYIGDRIIRRFSQLGNNHNAEGLLQVAKIDKLRHRYMELSTESMREIIPDVDNPGLLIIDTMRAAYPISFDEKDNMSIGKIMVPLKQFATKTGWAIMLVHHDKKSGGYSGGTALHSHADYAWSFTKDDDLSTLALIGTRDRSQQPLNFHYNRDTELLEFLGTDKDIHEANQREIDNAFKNALESVLPTNEDDAIGWSDIGHLLNWDKAQRTFENKYRPSMMSLIDAGTIGRKKEGRKQLFWWNNL